MADDWRKSTWGNEISLEYGKAIRDYRSGNGCVRVFGSNGPVGWTTTALVKGPGVILGRKGAYRGVEFSPHPFFVIDTAYYVVPKSDLDMRWLYYAIKHHKLGEIDDGSPIPSTTRSAVYVRDLEVPPLPEQKRIAHILGTLDDKIELNRRMNATLEAMARALFQSWFVDFDPVRAKAAGQTPAALDPATAALFPSEFEDSELGEIPKGWKVGTLGDVLKAKSNGVSVEEMDDSAAYIGLEHMPRRSIALDQWGTAADLQSNKSLFKRGDILFGKLRPYFHKVGIAPIDGVCSTDILVLNSKSPPFFGFAFCHCSSDKLIAHATSLSNGAKMPRTKWPDLRDYKVVLPLEPLAEHFNVTLRPLFDRIIANIHESRTLAALRDALLPKLLSGRINADEANAFKGSTQCQ